MSWERIRLGDIAEFSNGINFDKKAYAPGVKLISVSDFGNLFSPNYETLIEIKQEIVREKDCLKNNDIVFVRSNGNKELVGRCMLLRDMPSIPVTYSGFCIRARLKNTNMYDPVFFTYHFKNIDFRRAMSGTAIGANIQNLSQGKLQSYKAKIPDINTQRHIAGILSAYDDLIENNQKQIKLLEEAAQRLYKEWFVDLHFPGWENANIIDGVPEGWKKERLIDIAYVQYGFAFNGALFNSEKKGTPIIRIRNIPSAQTDDYTTESAEERYMVHNGDILIGMDGEFHINTWGGSDGYLVQRVCSFRPHDESIKGYLLQAIVAPIKFFEKTVVGATVAHLGKKHIDSIEILTAPAEYYAPFQTWYKKRQLLMNQNVFLKEARDRLLPKLMSDELEV